MPPVNSEQCGTGHTHSLRRHGLPFSGHNPKAVASQPQPAKVGRYNRPILSCDSPTAAESTADCDGIDEWPTTGSSLLAAQMVAQRTTAAGERLTAATAQLANSTVATCAIGPRSARVGL